MRSIMVCLQPNNVSSPLCAYIWPICTKKLPHSDDYFFVLLSYAANIQVRCVLLIMNKIDFGGNCLLTRHLEEVSILNSGLKAQFAGAMLSGLGFPGYARQLLDIKLITLLVQEIAKTKQTDLLSESRGKCVDCPESNNCGVGALFLNRLK